MHGGHCKCAFISILGKLSIILGESFAEQQFKSIVYYHLNHNFNSSSSPYNSTGMGSGVLKISYRLQHLTSHPTELNCFLIKLCTILLKEYTAVIYFLCLRVCKTYSTFFI